MRCRKGGVGEGTTSPELPFCHKSKSRGFRRHFITSHVIAKVTKHETTTSRPSTTTYTPWQTCEHFCRASEPKGASHIPTRLTPLTANYFVIFAKRWSRARRNGRAISILHNTTSGVRERKMLKKQGLEAMRRRERRGRRRVWTARRWIKTGNERELRMRTENRWRGR